MDETFLYLLDHDIRFPTFCSVITADFVEYGKSDNLTCCKIKKLSQDYVDSMYFIEDTNYADIVELEERSFPVLLWDNQNEVIPKLIEVEFRKLECIRGTTEALIKKSPSYLLTKLIYSDLTYFKAFLVNLYGHEKAIKRVLNDSLELNPDISDEVSVAYEKKIIQYNKQMYAKHKLLYNVKKGFMKPLPIELKVRIMNETLIEYSKGGFDTNTLKNEIYKNIENAR